MINDKISDSFSYIPTCSVFSCNIARNPSSGYCEIHYQVYLKYKKEIRADFENAKKKYEQLMNQWHFKGENKDPVYTSVFSKITYGCYHCLEYFLPEKIRGFYHEIGNGSETIYLCTSCLSKALRKNGEFMVPEER